MSVLIEPLLVAGCAGSGGGPYPQEATTSPTADVNVIRAATDALQCILDDMSGTPSLAAVRRRSPAILRGGLRLRQGWRSSDVKDFRP